MSRKRSLLMLLLACLLMTGAAPAKKPMVLLVTIDTIRADRLSCYGHTRHTTPAIDRLSREALLFRETVASVPLTTPSHASIFTGMHPRSHAVLGNSWQLDGSCKTLAEHFRGAGYRTAAFVSAVVLDPRCGLDQGFELYSAIERPAPDAALHSGIDRQAAGKEDSSRDRRRLAARQRTGEETVDAALAWMNRQRGGAPLFVWVHLYDPHQPYDPPEPYRQLYGPERGERNLSTVLRPSFDTWTSDQAEEVARRDLERHRERGRRNQMSMVSTGSLTGDEQARIDELYDGEIAVADFQVGRLLAWLKGRGLYQDALVVVVGDHGETMGEHQDYYGHHHVLYDSSLRIPLMIRLPGGGAGQLPQTTATTIDVAPTLLRAAGLVSPAGLDGRNLLSGPATRPVYCETYLGVKPAHRPEWDGERPTGGRRSMGMGIHQYAMRDGRWKLVMADSGGSPPMLFDLEADPGEKDDVSAAHQALVKALFGHWQRWCEAHALPQRSRNRRGAPGMDEEMRQKLRQLGYVE